MDPRMMGMPVRQKPVDFKILSSINPDVLAQEIKDHLIKGWVMHGELKVYQDKLIQAMVKIEIEQMGGGSDILVPRIM